MFGRGKDCQGFNDRYGQFQGTEQGYMNKVYGYMVIWLCSNRGDLVINSWAVLQTALLPTIGFCG